MPVLVQYLHQSILGFSGRVFVSNHQTRSSPPCHCQNGGVFWSKGELVIGGGSFIGNEAESDGGVIFASDDSTTKLTGGLFETNVARDGGVVIVCDNATLRVIAANVSGNDAHHEATEFSVDEGVDVEGGVYFNNTAEVRDRAWP